MKYKNGPKRRNIVKGTVRLVVGWAAGRTIKMLIDQNTEPDEEKRLDPVALTIGTSAIGWLVQDYVGRWTDEGIDDVFDAFADIKRRSTSMSPEG
jgi:hypothetical protein